MTNKNKHWSAEELLGACETAHDFDYNDNIYLLIGRGLDRPPSSVKSAIRRVRNGESCFQYNKRDPRFLKFMKEGVSVMKPNNEKINNEPIKTPTPEPAPRAEGKRIFSLKLCWGLVEITI
jgi:hypothetical protein